MVLTFVICVGVIRGSKGKGSINGTAALGCGVVAGVVGLGMMLFCSIVGLWDFITSVLIALVAAGLVAAAARRWTIGAGRA